jgi:hypothetical protein
MTKMGRPRKKKKKIHCATETELDPSGQAVMELLVTYLHRGSIQVLEGEIANQVVAIPAIGDIDSGDDL